jgi:two-component system chemotaxis response regulator CheB
MLKRDVIVIGGSAGGLEALQRILSRLDRNIGAAIFIVIHTSAGTPGVLPQILMRATGLSISYGEHDEPIVEGHVYVAPPDRHLLIRPGFLRVTRGPRENGFRPAIDPLFRTSAEAYGPRVIGVMLSGGGNDGTLGLAAIRRLGGMAVAQDPTEATVSSMPESAIRNVAIDHILTSRDIGTQMGQWIGHARPGRARMVVESPARPPVVQPDRAEVGTDLLHGQAAAGVLSVFTCPECGGSLWERSQDGLLTFRCHVGHSYTGETLLGQQDSEVEQAMWEALRSLEESAELRRRMAEHAHERLMSAIAADYLEKAAEFEARAAVIRRVLVAESPEVDAATEAVTRRARRAGEK